jgi:fatty acid synthase subunit alpha, fungi type
MMLLTIGVLTVAREAPSKFPSPLLDIKYRKRQLDLRRKQIKDWTESEYLYLQDEVSAMKSGQPDLDTEAYLRDRAENIEREAQRQLKQAISMWGNDFYKQDERIAPLRGALAVWGLTMDDLGVASMHGTSTVANDKNETAIVSEQMRHLGKSKGCVTLCVFQKYLTGHPKGAAAAWQLNGALQMLATGLVPGNRNADNVH